MTETKKAPNMILKLTFILFAVSAVTSLVLGLTNLLTKDKIAEQSRIATANAYNEVLPAESYEAVEFDSEAYPTVNNVYKAGDAGYIVDMSFSGAQSTVTAAVGIDLSGIVTGVAIIDHAETVGLGAKAVEPVYRDQYIGALDHVALTKNGGTIEAISGATITSRAVTDAVNTAMDVVASLG